MNVQKLETAVRWKIPAVSLVMNNNSWASEKAYQKYFYGERYVEADITNPRLDRLMDLFGGKGFYVERIQDLTMALDKALKTDVPTLIEIPVDPTRLPYPAHASDVLKDKKPTYTRSPSSHSVSLVHASIYLLYWLEVEKEGVYDLCDPQ